jgi:hypothetical protein
MFSFTVFSMVSLSVLDLCIPRCAVFSTLGKLVPLNWCTFSSLFSDLTYLSRHSLLAEVCSVLCSYNHMPYLGEFVPLLDLYCLWLWHPLTPMLHIVCVRFSFLSRCVLGDAVMGLHRFYISQRLRLSLTVTLLDFKDV